ncbi:hypothetical protein LTR35_002709 [Friedmanniomyces endolithicus]|uniref:Uncharacterized protein n=1 Tax=Friedmanniomyces endolithicus TaxID=329885 RepID=A0AAN6JFY3_9PEZI|nr:hypothetical protein LTS00_009974 [Friedmanniomyces endolithicus]KAK0289512.1 hypothetical protein LTR35_002709 [Friedmanniomyces endolithicus]KAK0328714.1 hypothetical protein LTR82_000646 [Friedmanniomyces endolithicus]KAK1019591.1 hypothetical protein LTR54_000233 [Friedmanniomyces endolithicus]
MTATNADDSSSDCDHWSDDATDLQHVAVAAPGYDSHNGLRAHIYHPAASQPPPALSSPKVAPVPHIIYYQQQPAPQQAFAYPTAQYTYATQSVAYPAPAYYAYGAQSIAMPPPQPQPQPPQQQEQVANYHVYQPAYSGEPPQPQGNLWVGRTKAQVDEDNMKLAATEGAWDKRKIVPTGVGEDQMMWCVEGDGSHTLRTFVSIKELKGEWNKYPGREESYYFVREVEEGGKKKKKG